MTNYFLFKSLGISFQIFATGSAQPQLPIRDLIEIPISLPPLPEQRAIACVLSSLDDKIDLLHRQNETLEALAQTLFRQWFVEDTEDDWEEKKLGEIIDTVSGFVHKRENLSDEGDYLLGMGSIIEAYGISREATKRASIKNLDTKYLCEVGDIVISTRDVTQDAKILGFPGIIPSFYANKNVIVGSNVYKLVIKSNNIPSWFIYQLLRSRKFRSYVKNFASGTSVLMLRKSDFLNFNFNLPKDQFFKEHYLLFESIHGKLDLNYSSVIQLENLRDTLLIKLMNGEVTIESLQGGKE
ncbi:MAG: restriction endonuclease subunit S [Candidatus Hodarchaeales archaeon]